MRFGTLRRIAVLASLSLFASGQLCMLTTCVPRLREAGAAAAHACCRTAPAQDAPGAPRPESPGAPPGTMPCHQVSNLTDAPTLAAPEPLAAAPALATEPEPAAVPAPRIERPRSTHDTGLMPGRDGPATAGLRAPPIA
jgi:hypothetical protein